VPKIRSEAFVHFIMDKHSEIASLLSHFASSEFKVPNQGLIYLGYLLLSCFLRYYFILVPRVCCMLVWSEYTT
jgi:hypothetical protein